MKTTDQVEGNVVTTTPPPSEQHERLLTAHDRCDRCGAQAYAVALKDNLDLLFCNHHFTKHQDVLEEQGFVIIDQTYRLHQSVSATA